MGTTLDQLITAYDEQRISQRQLIGALLMVAATPLAAGPWPGTDRALDIVQKRFPESEARTNQNQFSKAAEVRSVMLRDPDGINVQLGSVKYQL